MQIQHEEASIAVQLFWWNMTMLIVAIGFIALSAAYGMSYILAGSCAWGFSKAVDTFYFYSECQELEPTKGKRRR